MGKKHPGSGSTAAAPLAALSLANRSAWVGLLMALVTVSAWADAPSLTVIEVHFRPATELISQLRPLLADGASIMANDHQLLVRTTQSNLEDIRRALSSLDSPRQQLRLTVRERVLEPHQELSLTGITRDHVGASQNTPAKERPARILRTGPRPRTTAEQSIYVVEGRWSSLSIFSFHPQPVELAAWSGRTQGSLMTIDPSPNQTRIAVRARMQHGLVIVDISSNADGATENSASTAGQAFYSTSVSGQIGEWLTVGETASSIIALDSAWTGAGVSGNVQRVVTQVRVQVRGDGAR